MCNHDWQEARIKNAGFRACLKCCEVQRFWVDGWISLEKFREINERINLRHKKASAIILAALNKEAA